MPGGQTPATQTLSNQRSTARNSAARLTRTRLRTRSVRILRVRQLPQRLQELLGYNQPSPYLGFINGQHPRQWLMNDVAQPNRG